MERNKIFYDECVECGESPVKVETTETRDGYAYDGDAVTCPDCGLKGHVVVEEEETAWVNWNELEFSNKKP